MWSLEKVGIGRGGALDQVGMDSMYQLGMEKAGFGKSGNFHYKIV